MISAESLKACRRIGQRHNQPAIHVKKTGRSLYGNAKRFIRKLWRPEYRKHMMPVVESMQNRVF
ncbi:MAG: hypothetical protein ACXV8U_16175, partial [Methylobacter sp.]